MKKNLLIIDQGLLPREIECNSNDRIDIKILHVDLPQKKYPYTVFDKYINILLRLFFKFKNYSINRTYHYNSTSFLKDFYDRNDKSYYDYILITRPDNFDDKFIKEISKFSDHIVGYVWDSISDDKYRRLKKINHKFMSLYCYDVDSVRKYRDINLKYITNFYYSIDEINIGKENKSILMSYIGNNVEGRYDIISEILRQLEVENLNENSKKNEITLVERHSKLSDSYFSNGIRLTNTKISTKEYLNILSQSFLALDLIPPYNNGFSFRLFEATYTKTKLITTNQFVKELRFYHPDNIFIYNEQTKHMLSDFIKKPFVEIEPELIEYYCIDNWLKRILELE